MEFGKVTIVLETYIIKSAVQSSILPISCVAADRSLGINFGNLRGTHHITGAEAVQADRHQRIVADGRIATATGG